MVGKTVRKRKMYQIRFIFFSLPPFFLPLAPLEEAGFESINLEWFEKVIRF